MMGKEQLTGWNVMGLGDVYTGHRISERCA